MAVKVTPVKSNVIYLQDIDADFLKLEGADCPESERAWVTVRQATEGDEIQIADLRAKRVARWIPDGKGNAIPEEHREINERLIWCNQVFLCLTGAGNILDEDGAELFSFRGGKVGTSYAEFKRAWGKLPEEVTLPILKAVYALNPHWDWLWTQAEREGEVYQGLRVT